MEDRIRKLEERIALLESRLAMLEARLAMLGGMQMVTPPSIPQIIPQEYEPYRVGDDPNEIKVTC